MDESKKSTTSPNPEEISLVEIDNAIDSSSLNKAEPPSNGPKKLKIYLSKTMLFVVYPMMLLLCLYFFICSLDLMSVGFRLLGGKLAGKIIKDAMILSNPLAGIMIGMLMTVLLQSSSTTTSIIITMIATNIISVYEATFMIMGANIGTSVTNTIVALGQMGSRIEFKQAFAGATVHDMFNWLTVAILLPLELLTGYLNIISYAIVSRLDFTKLKMKKIKLLKVITKPLTKLILPIDKKILTNPEKLLNVKTIIKTCCKKTKLENATIEANSTSYICTKKCQFLFQDVAGVWSDTAIGTILTILALIILVLCLVCLVRLLKRLFLFRFVNRMKTTIEVTADTEGLETATNTVSRKNNKKNKYVRCFQNSEILSIFIGCGMTIMIQSSSAFTSALTPLVGTGLIPLPRMFALTMGANVGTTVTGILSALAQNVDKMQDALQAALIHLMFNISGVLLWYPIPAVRKIPISMAKRLGKTTYHYRWFAILYLMIFFIILPLIVFCLSLISWILSVVFSVILVVILLTIFIISKIQKVRPQVLPNILQNWKFLPQPLRSLKPYDKILMKLICCKRWKKEVTECGINVEEKHSINNIQSVNEV